MSIKIALAGNPNCGKTTLFNNLTGSNQYVGNWPGVTVEKKEGKLKGDKDVIIQDLPGIYSLSPYTLEEVVSRTYLVKEKPDAILNIIDGTNIERNLYLTTQLIELGIPVVMAVNMIDLVRKNGDKIDLKKLSAELGCQAVEISALKGEGTEAAAKAAVAAAKATKAGELPHVFTGSVEHAIAHIEESIQGKVDDRFLRWYAVKLFERDDKVQDELKLDKALMDHIDQHIKDCETELDDDAESIITNQRYAYINTVVGKAVKKKARVEHLTVSDKIDQIVTNRILALPIFALIMYLMYSLSMGTSIADGGWAIGTFATDWTNDVLFGEIVPNALGGFLESIGGLEEMHKRNIAKAKVIYDFLDSSKMFNGTVEPQFRSLMNIPFVTESAELDAEVVAATKAAGYDNLKGHKSVGGLRASVYNAMPIEGAQALVEFLKKFEAEHK